LTIVCLHKYYEKAKQHMQILEQEITKSKDRGRIVASLQPWVFLFFHEAERRIQKQNSVHIYPYPSALLNVSFLLVLTGLFKA